MPRRSIRRSDAGLQTGGGGVRFSGAVQQGHRWQERLRHESGIHQDGMLKNAETYEIMRPEDVGVRETSLVMGKHSGRHAFKEKLVSAGL
jgi:2-isopropylmalate synthase